MSERLYPDQETPVTEFAAAPARHYAYKPGGQLARYTVLLLRLGCIGALAYAAAGLNRLWFYSRFSAELNLWFSAGPTDLFYVSALVIYLGLLVTSGVLFLFWVYRAAANVHSVDADAMTITPRWAVGWNFIPIAWYWKPYQAVKEIWNASHGRGAAEGPVPAVFGWWWGCWIASQIIGHIGDRIQETGMENSDLSKVKLGTALGIVDALLFVAAAFLLAKIVDELTRAQDQLLANAAVIFE